MSDTAMEILKNSPLSEPRMMGTEGERATTEFLKNYLSEHSLNPQTEQIKWSTAIVNGLKLLKVFIGLFMVFFNISLRFSGPFNGYIPIATVLLMFAFIVVYMKILKDGKLNFMGKSATGDNIICQIGEDANSEDNPKNEVYLTAHYDSIASSMPKFSTIGLASTALCLLITLLLSITTGILSLIRHYAAVSNLEKTIGIFQWTILGVTTIAILLIFISLFSKRTNDSAGACDNGSGSAILLELAAYFGQNSLKNTKLTFIWCTAEEWGLYGSKEYVKAHKEELLAKKDRFYNINVDMVGQEIAYIEKKGFLSAKPLNQTLNKLIKEAAEEKGIEVRGFKCMLVGSSDHASFKKIKLEVSTFLSKKDFMKIHCDKDTLDIVNPEKMTGAVELIKTVILKLDQKE